MIEDIPAEVLAMGKLADISKVSFEQKDVFMREMKAGRTIGEAKTIAGITLYEACEVLNENIQQRHYISPETVR